MRGVGSSQVWTPPAGLATPSSASPPAVAELAIASRTPRASHVPSPPPHEELFERAVRNAIRRTSTLAMPCCSSRPLVDQMPLSRSCVLTGIDLACHSSTAVSARELGAALDDAHQNSTKVFVRAAGPRAPRRIRRSHCWSTSSER
jgi:hypothetical protein